MTNNIIPKNFAYPNLINIKSALYTQTPNIKDRNEIISLIASVKSTLSEDEARDVIMSWASKIYPKSLNKILKIFKSVKHPKISTAGALFKKAFESGWTPDSSSQAPAPAPAPNRSEILKKSNENKDREQLIRNQLKLLTLVAGRPILVEKSDHNYLRNKNIDEVYTRLIRPKEVYSNDYYSDLLKLPAFTYKNNSEVTDDVRAGNILATQLYDLTKEGSKIKYVQSGWELIPTKLVAEINFNKFQLSLNSESWTKLGVVGVKVPNAKYSGTIVLAEGFSTAATIAMYYSQYFCTYSCGKDNLLRAATDLRKCYRKAKIIIAADNDLDDAGLIAALAAAKSAKARITMPSLAGFDFNDLHTKLLSLNDKERKKLFKKNFNTLQNLTNPQKNKTKNLLPEFKTEYEVIAQTDKLTTINSRFMGASISDLSKIHKAIAIVSPMGSGKTDSIKFFLKEVDGENNIIVYISPRVRLNYAIQEEDDLLIKVYRRGLQGQELLNTAVTPISLPDLMDDIDMFLLEEEENHRKIYVILDEVNAINSLITSKVNKSKVATFDVLARLCRSASNVLAMDAFLNAPTEKFLNYVLSMTVESIEDIRDIGCLMQVSDKQQFHKLENINKPWSNYIASIITTEAGVKDKDRRGAMVGELLRDIESGKKLYVACQSSTFAHNLYSLIGKLYENVNKVYLASQKAENLTETDKRLALKLLQNPGKIMEKFDVIIAGPAVSVGISLNKKDEFHKVYGFASNYENTGDSESFVQTLARMRSVRTKKWRIFLESPKTVFEPVLSIKNATALLQESIMNKYKDPELFRHVLPIAEIGATNDYNYKKDKNKYNNNVIALLKSMGMLVEQDVQPIYPVPSKIIDAQAEVAQELQEAEKALILSSSRISPKSAKKISLKVKYNFHAATREEYGKHLRFMLEHQYQCNLDVLNEQQTEDIFDMWHDNIFYKLNRREQAELFLEDTSFCKRLETAIRTGVGESEAFKQECLSNKIEVRAETKLYSFVVKLFSEDAKFSKKIRGSALPLIKWLCRKKVKHGKTILNNADNLVRLGIVRITQAQIKKPQILIKKLAENLAYEVVKNKKQENGKRYYTYHLTQSENVKKLAFVRKEDGTTYPETIGNLLNQYEKNKKPEEIELPCNAQNPVNDDEESRELLNLTDRVEAQISNREELAKLINDEEFLSYCKEISDAESRENEREKQD